MVLLASLDLAARKTVSLSPGDDAHIPFFSFSQELLSKDIPTVTKDGVTCHVIAGEGLGAKVRVTPHL